MTVSTLADGASTSNLSNPVGVAIEPSGSLVVSDFDNDDLVRVSTQGVVTTLTSQPGFTRPYALAYDATRDVLYSETDANPSGTHNFSTATIWTINRGSGAASNLVANVGTARGIAVLSDGRLVLGDYGNHVVRLLDPTTGAVTVLAGSTACVGDVNGAGTGASFNGPYGVAELPNDDNVVADWIARVLRRVTLAGVVTTFAGDGGPAGTIDGPAATARFNRPRALAADAAGNVYVSDDLAWRIRRIGADGTVSTLAGAGTQGFMDGAGNVAEFFGQEGDLRRTPDGSTIYVGRWDRGSDTPIRGIIGSMSSPSVLDLSASAAGPRDGAGLVRRLPALARGRRRNDNVPRP